MLTEAEYQKLQSQKWDLLAQIQKADEERNAIKILKNEEQFVGKFYKIRREYEYSDESEILYIKVLSAINRSTYDVHTMDFVIPLSVKFQHRISLNATNNRFDFCFQDGDIIWFDEHPISDLQNSNKAVEIDIEEYNTAMSTLFTKIMWINEHTENYNLNRLFGERYEREIKSLSIQQREKENKEIQKEN